MDSIFDIYKSEDIEQLRIQLIEEHTKVTELTTELEVLKTFVDTKDYDDEQYVKEIQLLKNQIGQFSDERDELQRKVRVLEASLGEENACNNDLNERLKDEENKTADLEMELNYLKDRSLEDRLEVHKLRGSVSSLSLNAEKNEEISGYLSEELHTREEELDELRIRLQEAHRLIERLQDGDCDNESGTEGDVQFRITALKASIDVQSERNAELTDKLKGKDKKIKQMDREIIELKEKGRLNEALVKEVTMKSDKDRGKIDKLSRESMRFKRENEGFRKSILELKAQVEEAKVQHDETKKAFEDQKRDRFDAKMQLDKERRAYARHKDDVERFRVKSTATKKNYEELRVQYTEMKKQFEDKKNDLKMKSSQLSSKQKLVQELEKWSKELEASNEEAQKTIDMQDKELKQKDLSIEAMKTNIREREREMAESLGNAKSANEKWEDHSRQFEMKCREVAEKDDIIEQLRLQIYQLDNDIRNKDDDVRSIKSTIDEHRNILQHKDKQLNEAHKTLQVKLKEVAERETRVQQLESTSMDLERLLEFTKSDTEQLKKGVEEKEAVIQKIAIEATQKGVELEELRNEKEEKKTMLERQTEKIRQLENEVAEREKILVDLRCQVQELNDIIDEKDQEIKNLKVSCENQTKLIKEKEKKLWEAEQVVEKQRQRLDNLENELQHKEEQFEKKTKSITDELWALRKEVGEKDMIIEKQIIDENYSVEQEQTLKKYKMDLEDMREQREVELQRFEETKKELLYQHSDELKRQRETRRIEVEGLKEDMRDLEKKLDLEKDKRNKADIDLKTATKNSGEDQLLLKEKLAEIQNKMNKEQNTREDERKKSKQLEQHFWEEEERYTSKINELERGKRAFQLEKKQLLLKVEEIKALKKEVEAKTNEIHQFALQREVEKQEMKKIIEETEKLNKLQKVEIEELRNNSADVFIQSSLNQELCSLPGEFQFDDGPNIDEGKQSVSDIKMDIEQEYEVDKIFKGDSSKLGKSRSHTKFGQSPRVSGMSGRMKNLIATALKLELDDGTKEWLEEELKGLKTDLEALKEKNDELRHLADKLTSRIANEISEKSELEKKVEEMKSQSEKENERKENQRRGLDKTISHDKMCMEQQRKSVEYLTLQSRIDQEMKETQQKEIEELQRVRESDRKFIEDQGKTISNLEISMKNIYEKMSSNKHSKPSEFMSYEHLKAQIEELKRQREKQMKDGLLVSRRLQPDFIQKEKEVKENETKEKAKGWKMIMVPVLMAIICILLVLVYQRKSTASIGISLVVAAISLVFNIKMWRDIKRLKKKYDTDIKKYEDQNTEVEELGLVLDKEHEVVIKQRLAIEALEKQLQDELRRNEEQQFMIAKMPRTLHEHENIDHPAKGKLLQSHETIGEVLHKVNAQQSHTKLDFFKDIKKQIDDDHAMRRQQAHGTAEMKTSSADSYKASNAGFIETSSSEDRKRHRISSIIAMSMYAITLALACAFGYRKVAFTTAALSAAHAYWYMKTSKAKSRISTGPESQLLPRRQSVFRVYFLEILFGASMIGLTVMTKLPVSSVLAALVMLFVIKIFLLWNFLQKVIGRDNAQAQIIIDLKSRIRDETQRGDKQSREAQAMKRLLEVERSYQRKPGEFAPAVSYSIGKDCETQTESTFIKEEKEKAQIIQKLLREFSSAQEVMNEQQKDLEDMRRRLKALEYDNMEKIEDFSKIRDLTKYERDEAKVLLEEERRKNRDMESKVITAQEYCEKLQKDIARLRKDKSEVEEQGKRVKTDMDRLLQGVGVETSSVNGGKINEELRKQLQEKQQDVETLTYKLELEHDEKIDKLKQLDEMMNQLTREKQRVEKMEKEVAARDFKIDEIQESMHRLQLTKDQNETKMKVEIKILNEEIEMLQKQMEESRSLGGMGDEKQQEWNRMQQLDIEQLKKELEDISTANEALRRQEENMQGSVKAKSLKYEQMSITAEEHKHKAEQLEVELQHEKEKNVVLEESVKELKRQQKEERKRHERSLKKMSSVEEESEEENHVDGPSEDNSFLTGGVSTEYEDNADTRGILYWLGTNGGKTEWCNPAERGLVTVTRSSYGHGKAMDVADRKASWCSTSNKPNQWWKVDFGEKTTVNVAAYSLRHGWSGTAGALRNWALEGSNDNKKWNPLSVHKNDATLNGKYAFATWKIDAGESHYRYVRVRQIGKNSAGTHALRLCGLEVYGQIMFQ